MSRLDLGVCVVCVVCGDPLAVDLSRVILARLVCRGPGVELARLGGNKACAGVVWLVVCVCWESPGEKEREREE